MLQWPIIFAICTDHLIFLMTDGGFWLSITTFRFTVRYLLRTKMIASFFHVTQERYANITVL